MSARPLLVVQHEDQCPPARVGDWLSRAGVRLDVRRPYAGDPLPDSLDAHTGLLVLGGHPSANDDFAWRDATLELMRDGARDGVPVFGVCLGHQLCAVALGGRVQANPRGQQAGVLDLGWRDGADLFGHRPAAAIQWNNDLVTELPPGAVTLAATPAGEIQAARFAPTVWGVQSHPEADEQIVGPWAAGDRPSDPDRIDAAVAAVAAAQDRLHADWRPVWEAYAALLGAEVSPSRRRR